ncbi:MAG: hypothetical protein JNN20_06940 [Betaproteobacteria bacterium]|nr:hypothetical protein [Betaproteobacteria bacterium]
MNVAVQVELDDIVSDKLAAVPAQAPDQPANVEPDVATAVNATDVSLGKLAVQLLPQLMPTGDEVIVPAPVPAFTTLSETMVGAAVKLA